MLTIEQEFSAVRQQITTQNTIRLIAGLKNKYTNQFKTISPLQASTYGLTAFRFLKKAGFLDELNSLNENAYTNN